MAEDKILFRGGGEGLVGLVWFHLGLVCCGFGEFLVFN